MRPIVSRVQPQSESFRQNYAANSHLLEQLQSHLAESRSQGADKYIERARSRGKLLARERIQLVLDPDSPFLELLPLAGLGRKPIALGGTLVGGIGLVSGVLTMVTANVGTVKGGTIDEVTLQKGQRLNEIARENKLPVIYLVESGGANLPDQAKIFNYGGITFREITRRSQAGLATIAVVHGNATAGGAYVPGMADYAIMVKQEAKVFLAGPPLVKMATNEIADEESLGGAEMHSSISGVSDFMAADDRDGIRMARELMEVVAFSTQTAMPPLPADAPRYGPDELLGILPADPRQPFDVREVIARVVDGSRFLEFKPAYGNTLVTGYASIHGYPVGILANNGVLFSEAANKGAQFIQLCNRHKVPLVFLQNITGFMVGTKYEQEGIIKHGAKLINAVSNSGVPILTVIVGSSYGAGNYAMAGRAYEPRLLFSYPNSKIAVMGPDQLAGVMEIVQREAAEKSGQPYDEQQGELVKAMVRQQVEKESNAWYATGQLWDDGIIDPRETRHHLGFGLAMLFQAGFTPTDVYGVFRM
jgi:acyl-CoA carboxylase subunit beta